MRYIDTTKGEVPFELAAIFAAVAVMAVVMGGTLKDWPFLIFP